MSLIKGLLQLEEELSYFERRVVLRNILQSISDYRTLVSRQYLGFNSKEAYTKVLETFFENVVMNVRLLNQLCKLYQVEPIFKGDIKDRKQVDFFTIDLVAGQLL